MKMSSRILSTYAAWIIVHYQILHHVILPNKSHGSFHHLHDNIKEPMQIATDSILNMGHSKTITQLSDQTIPIK